MSQIIPQDLSRTNSFTVEEVRAVQQLLQGANRPSWASRPCIYILLRSLGCLDLMQGFVAAALWDRDLPLEVEELPEMMTEDESLRNGFLSQQRLLGDVVPKKKSDSGEQDLRRALEQISFEGEVSPEKNQAALIDYPLDVKRSDGGFANEKVDEKPIVPFIEISDSTRTASGRDEVPVVTLASDEKPPERYYSRARSSSLDPRGGIVSTDSAFEKIPTDHSRSASSRNSFSSVYPERDNAPKPWYRRSFSAFSSEKMPLLSNPDKSNYPIPVQDNPHNGAIELSSSPTIKHTQAPKVKTKKKSKSFSRFLDVGLAQPPILEAARTNNFELMSYLLRDTPGDLQFTDSAGFNAFHIAAYEGHLRLLRLLLPNLPRGSIPIDDRTRKTDLTALSIAAKQGHLDCCQLLLSINSDINATSRTDGATPLHRAALGGHVSVCAYLLDYYANLPPHIQARNVPLINRPDAEGLTPIFWAVQGAASPEVITLLAARGADLTQRTTNSRDTVLQRAVSAGNSAIVRMLLQLGADPDADGMFGMRAIHTAASRGDVAMLHVLVEEGNAKLYWRTERGWTCLHFAARWGHQGCVGTLVRMGADVKAVEEQGRTAGEIARLEGHEVGLPLDKYQSVVGGHGHRQGLDDYMEQTGWQQTQAGAHVSAQGGGGYVGQSG